MMWLTLTLFYANDVALCANDVRLRRNCVAKWSFATHGFRFSLPLADKATVGTASRTVRDPMREEQGFPEVSLRALGVPSMPLPYGRKPQSEP